MLETRLELAIAAGLLSVSLACGGGAVDRAGEPGAAGTTGAAQGGAPDTAAAPGAAGKSAGTVLTGCLEKNMRSGQFELVLQGGDARPGDVNAGMQPGHQRLELVKEGDIELNQHVGRRVTLEGMLGSGQPVSDAGTRSYAVGERADSSQTRSREGDSRRMTVRSIENVGEACQAEKR